MGDKKTKLAREDLSNIFGKLEAKENIVACQTMIESPIIGPQ